MKNSFVIKGNICQTKNPKELDLHENAYVEIDPDNYDYIPEVKQTDYYDNDVPQRVAIYVRVSTDDVRQTTSFELQKKYYEDFVVKHPHWTLVKIYADEGISGTSLNKREQFLEMIADAKRGKIDMIITKSVSRFARNVVDFIGIVRDLAERNPPVGVFFESEAIFSLNDDSQLALSFQATMAEEESHTRSRSMESSLRMRLDNGIPLTPKLLGYMHDADGQLIPNPEEAPTVKLAFYMYLYGYSTQQIADAFNALGRKSYLGNINWTSTGIVQILRNERHCGDVLTRKTFTPNFRTHKSKKNKGQRPQSRYRNHHPGIVTQDDFIAVQRMLDNAKYGNKSILPEIRVVEDGVLKGFVTINPRWAGFKEGDYYQASKSVYSSPEEEPHPEEEIRFEVEAGDFDLRGFEIARDEFFDDPRRPHAIIYHKFIKFNTACVRKFGTRNYIEILINPISRKLAIRPTTKENRNSVMAAKPEKGILYPRTIPTSAFSETMFNLLGWNINLSKAVQPSRSSYSLGIPPTKNSTSWSFAVALTAENNKAIFITNSFLLHCHFGGRAVLTEHRCKNRSSGNGCFVFFIILFRNFFTIVQGKFCAFDDRGKFFKFGTNFLFRRTHLNA